jgi:PAS domain S-box-containing protein
MLLSHGGMFTPIDLKQRVFRKVPRQVAPGATIPADPIPLTGDGTPSMLDRIRDEALLGGPIAQLVITADGLVAMVNHQAEMLLGVSTRDRGRPFRDLDVSYRPLEPTNEELQSTVEELETTNEELHSTNDELQAINDELQDRTGQLDESNAFLEAILTGLRAGVVVLAPDMSVRVWNQEAHELWGLRPEETIGQHFLTLDIGLPLEELAPMIRRALGGEPGRQELALPAVNRRGRRIDVRVVGSPLTSYDDRPAGVILMMEQDARADGHAKGQTGDGAG